MTVRIHIMVTSAVEDCTEQDKSTVEMSMAQFRESLEAVIEQKLRSEVPNARVSFDQEQDHDE